MKAFRREPDNAECGQVEVSDKLGYVWLEAHDLDALEAVICALNAYDEHLARIAELEGQVAALVEACETGLATLNVQPCNNGPTIRHAQWVFRAALALVRGEGGK